MTDTTANQKTLSYEWQPSPRWYVIVRGFFGVLFHTLWPLRVRGVEYVPKRGAAMVKRR